MEATLSDPVLGDEGKQKRLLTLYRSRQRDLSRLLTPSNIQRIRGVFMAKAAAMRRRREALRRGGMGLVDGGKKESGEGKGEEGLKEEELEGGEEVGLRLAEFVHIMERCVGAFVLHEREFVAQLVALFREVDADDNRSLSWRELSSHLVQSGLKAQESASSAFAPIFSYASCCEPDLSSHTGLVSHSFLVSLDNGRGETLLGTLEQGSPLVRLYRTISRRRQLALVTAKAIRHETSYAPHEVLCAIHLGTARMIATTSRASSSGPFHVSFFDEATGVLIHRTQTATLCDQLAWSETTQLVYACGPDGRSIRGYSPMSGLERQRLPQIGSAARAICCLPGAMAPILLSGTADGQMRPYDLRTGNPRTHQTLTAHELGVAQILLAARADRVVTRGRPFSTTRPCPGRYNVVLVWPLHEWLHASNGSSSSSSSDSYTSPEAKRRAKFERAQDLVARVAVEGQRKHARRHKRPAHLKEHDADGSGEILKGVVDGEVDPEEELEEEGGEGGEEWEDENGGLDEEDLLLAKAAEAVAAGPGRGTLKVVGEFGRGENGFKLRPLVLAGHEWSVVSVAVQDEPTCVPHVVSLDASGIVKVWHLLRGTEMQSFSILMPHLRPIPAAAAAAATSTSMSTSSITDAGRSGGGGGGGGVRGGNGGKKKKGGRRRGARLSVSSMAEIPSVVIGAITSASRDAQDRGPVRDRMSYSSASLALFPDHSGTGAAEASLAAEVEKEELSGAADVVLGSEDIVAIEARVDGVSAGVGMGEGEEGKKRDALLRAIDRPSAVTEQSLADAKREAAGGMKGAADQGVTIGEYAVSRAAVEGERRRRARAKEIVNERRRQERSRKARLHQASVRVGDSLMLSEASMELGEFDGDADDDGDDEERDPMRMAEEEAVVAELLSAELAGSGSVKDLDGKLKVEAMGSEVGSGRQLLAAATSIACLPSSFSSARTPVPTLSVGGSALSLLGFQQSVPELLPMLDAKWVWPQLGIATVTSQAAVMWDSITGRPMNIVRRENVCTPGSEVSALCIDRRQRKAVIGDSLGGISVINLQTGAAMKQLDPVGSATLGEVQLHLTLEHGEEHLRKQREREAAMRKMNPRDRAAAEAAEEEAEGPRGSTRVRKAAAAELIYLPRRQAVVCVSSNGQVVVMDDVSDQGFDKDAGLSTLLRRVPIPIFAFTPTASTSVPSSAFTPSAKRAWLPRGVTAEGPDPDPAEEEVKPHASPAAARITAWGQSLRSGIGSLAGDVDVTAVGASDTFNLLATASEGPPEHPAVQQHIPTYMPSSSSSSSSSSAGLGYPLVCLWHIDTMQLAGILEPELAQHRDYIRFPFRGREAEDLSFVTGIFPGFGEGDGSSTSASDGDGREIVAIRFLEPYPAVMLVSASGRISVWALYPAEDPFTLRISWSLPPSERLALVSTVEVSAGDVVGLSQFGTMGAHNAVWPLAAARAQRRGESPQDTLAGGLVVWAGTSSGEVHRWRLPHALFVRAGLDVQLVSHGEGVAKVPEPLPRDEAEKVTYARLQPPGVDSPIPDPGTREAQLPPRRVTPRQVVSVLRDTSLANLRRTRHHLKTSWSLDDPRSCPDDTFSSLLGLLPGVLGEVYPESLAAFEGGGVVWETAWRAHALPIRSIDYSVDFGAILTSSADGLARVWDAECRLLGSLDTTPRFTAPAPPWDIDHVHAQEATEAHIEVEAIVKEKSEGEGKKRGVDASMSELRSRIDPVHEPASDMFEPPEDRAEGVGTGSGRSADRRNMRHVAVRRIFPAGLTRAFQVQARPAQSSLRGRRASVASIAASVRAEPTHAAELRHLSVSFLTELPDEYETAKKEKDEKEEGVEGEEIVVARRATAVEQSWVSPVPTGFAVVDVVAGTPKQPPRVVFCAHSPEQAAVVWHYEPDMLRRVRSDFDEASEVLRYVRILRLRDHLLDGDAKPGKWVQRMGRTRAAERSHSKAQKERDVDKEIESVLLSTAAAAEAELDVPDASEVHARIREERRRPVSERTRAEAGVMRVERSDAVSRLVFTHTQSRREGGVGTKETPTHTLPPLLPSSPPASTPTSTPAAPFPSQSATEVEGKEDGIGQDTPMKTPERRRGRDGVRGVFSAPAKDRGFVAGKSVGELEKMLAEGAATVKKASRTRADRGRGRSLLASPGAPSYLSSYPSLGQSQSVAGVEVLPSEKLSGLEKELLDSCPAGSLLKAVGPARKPRTSGAGKSAILMAVGSASILRKVRKKKGEKTKGV